MGNTGEGKLSVAMLFVRPMGHPGGEPREMSGLE